jgi:hypothetical protein
MPLLGSQLLNMSRHTPEKGFGTKMNPFKILKDAITAVPSVRYALGVAGIAAAVSIILGFIKDPEIAVFGILITIGLMYLLVISSPYTFFLLNSDMELYRNRHLFV